MLTDFYLYIFFCLILCFWLRAADLTKLATYISFLRVLNILYLIVSYVI